MQRFAHPSAAVQYVQASAAAAAEKVREEEQGQGQGQEVRKQVEGRCAWAEKAGSAKPPGKSKAQARHTHQHTQAYPTGHTERTVPVEREFWFPIRVLAELDLARVSPEAVDVADDARALLAEAWGRMCETLVQWGRCLQEAESEKHDENALPTERLYNFSPAIISSAPMSFVPKAPALQHTPNASFSSPL
eukprot:jgi/Chlat1/3593/Chrsp234S03601